MRWVKSGEQTPVIFGERLRGGWEPLRDDARRWSSRLWNGLQNHSERRAHYSAQLLLAKWLTRWRVPPNRTGPGHRRELLRDNDPGRSLRQWDNLQNDAHWYAHHAVQRLLADGLPRRQLPVRRADSGHRWKLVRDNADRWGHRLWDNLQNHHDWHSTLTTLYSFCSQSGCTDGEYPAGGLVQDTNGNLYGTTADGGVNGDGTAFSLSTGLSPRRTS